MAKAWEKQPGETDNEFEAFIYYLWARHADWVNPSNTKYFDDLANYPYKGLTAVWNQYYHSHPELWNAFPHYWTAFPQSRYELKDVLIRGWCDTWDWPERVRLATLDTWYNPGDWGNIYQGQTGPTPHQIYPGRAKLGWSGYKPVYPAWPYSY